MESMRLVGYNTKWYRFQKGLTQEEFAALTNFKMAYISIIESGNANLTCGNIDVIAKALGLKPEKLFIENTALKGMKLPSRVYMYKK